MRYELHVHTWRTFEVVDDFVPGSVVKLTDMFGGFFGGIIRFVVFLDVFMQRFPISPMLHVVKWTFKHKRPVNQFDKLN